jgi:hypothetical protein
VSFGDVVDELLDQHGLADTGTTEKTNFSTTSVWGEEVDDLDACFEDLSGGGLVDEGGRIGMDGGHFDALDGPTLIDGLTDDVHDTPQGRGADWNLNGRAGVDDFLATYKTLGTVHSDGADRVFAQMGGDLEDETPTCKVPDLQSVEDGGQVFSLELDVDDCADDGFYATDALGLCCV